jgi:SCP-2 sterol transfer family
VAEFLSEMWLGELDRAVRASASVSALAPIVIEQVVRDVPGRGEVRYRIYVDDGGARVAEGDTAERPDVRLTTDYPTAVAIALGEENAQTALARGRLRLGGDIDTLARRAGALAALDDATAAVRAATTYPSP